MSFKFIDKNAILEDEHQQRLKRIKLIERETAEMAPIFAEKQKALFPTAIQLTQTPTMGQVITEETQRNAENSDVLYQRAEQKIKQIADTTNAEYILDRLDDLDLKYLVNGWDGILRTVKEKYSSSGLDKDIFIGLIKENASNMDMTSSSFDTKMMTERGKLRKEQKDYENLLIEGDIKDRQKQEMKDKRKFEKLVEKNESIKMKDLEKQKQEMENRNAPPTLSRNAKKHQKYLLRKEAKNDSSNQVRNVMFDMLDELASDETPESKDVRRVINDMIGKIENKDKKSKTDEKQNDTGVEESKTPYDEGAEDNDGATQSKDEEGQEMLKFLRPNKVFKSKYYLNKYKVEYERLVKLLNNATKEEIDDFIQDVEKNHPAYPLIKQKYPNANDKQISKLLVSMGTAKNLFEEEQHYVDSLGSDASKIIDEELYEPPKTPPKPIRIRLNKANKKFYEDDLQQYYEELIKDTKDNVIKLYSEQIGEPKKNTKINTMIKKLLNQRAMYVRNQLLRKQSSNVEIKKATKQLRSDVNLLDIEKQSSEDLNDIYKTLQESINKQRKDKNVVKGTPEYDILIDMLRYKQKVYVELKKRGTIGNGLRKKIIGSGYQETPIEVRKRKNSVMKKVINGKYIDMNKLNDNIICIRYCSTNALIPTIKVQRVSDDVKGIITDIINDKFEKRLYEKLSVDEKRIIKRFVHVLSLDTDVNDKMDDDYKRQFEIVLGEWSAGNSNKAIKSKLKQYITESMESGFLPRRQCFKLLFELANSD